MARQVRWRWSATRHIIFSALGRLVWWTEIPDALSLAGGLLIITGGVIAFAPTQAKPLTNDVS